jgi:hypothetical protein
MKNFSLLTFDKLIKIIENPLKLLSVDAGILVDKISFNNFMNKCETNFYSLAYSIRFFFIFIAFNGHMSEMGEDDINKKIEKKASDLKPMMTSALKDILTYKNKNKSEARIDLLLLKEFFNHSLNDQVFPINFSLYYIKRLHEVIVPNIDKIRVLNKGFDLMDVIFFNKKEEYYLGSENGLINYSIGLDNDQIAQINIKTRALAYQNPQTLMRCQHCEMLMLHEFNIANEKVFYEEFEFIMKSSKEGRMLEILKLISRISRKSDKMTDILKEELKRSEDLNLKENLYLMFTMIAIERKSELLLQEDDIGDQDKLINIMLNSDSTNARLLEYCKKIISKYEEMKNHLQYHELLLKTFNEIKNNPKINDQNVFKRELYEKVKKNFERGYGNPDVLRYINSLDGNCKLVKLCKHIEDMPKSKNLFEKLSKDKKAKLLPIREYKLRSLINKKIIVGILLKDCDAEQK